MAAASESAAAAAAGSSEATRAVAGAPVTGRTAADRTRRCMHEESRGNGAGRGTGAADKYEEKSRRSPGALPIHKGRLIITSYAQRQ